jgi:SAM-dependent methyltransferase
LDRSSSAAIVATITTGLNGAEREHEQLMGLSGAFLADLVELKRSGALDGCSRVVEIGAQQLADSFLTADDLLTDLYRAFDRPRVDLGSPVGPEHFSKRAPAARAFWQSLGLEHASIDLTQEHDSIVLDLNNGTVPPDWRGRFDFVVNAGSTEHVANQDNAFRVIHDLTRKGGIMWHEVPSAGMLNHGYFLYHPRFFYDLCKVNGYGPVELRNDRHDPDGCIRAALRKQHDKLFATPLDIADSAPNPEIVKMHRTGAARHLAKRICFAVLRRL